MEMTLELIPEMILELTGDQAEIGDPDGCPLTIGPYSTWLWAPLTILTRL